jgi:hypothetical protein
LAPLLAQWDALQISTCRLVQYMVFSLMPNRRCDRAR